MIKRILQLFSCQRSQLMQNKLALPLRCLLMLLMLNSAAIAKDKTERIEQVKAVFVLNIVRFVKWPNVIATGQSGQLTLCVQSKNSINQSISNLHGKQLSGKVLQVARINSYAEAAHCNIVLIANNELEGYHKYAANYAGTPVLTIVDQTELEPASRPIHGVMVALMRNGSRIGFEINLSRVRKTGLEMSSRLLNLATIIGKEN